MNLVAWPQLQEADGRDVIGGSRQQQRRHREPRPQANHAKGGMVAAALVRGGGSERGEHEDGEQLAGEVKGR